VLVGFARPLAKLLAEFAGQIPNDQILASPGATHGEHLATVVFALELGFPFDFEILLGREERLRLRGHAGLSLLT
jgi:hypothetical protein